MILFNRKLSLDDLDGVLIASLKRRAESGLFDGTLGSKIYLDACSEYDSKAGTYLIFTRDHNHHMSGWWKNPDYERCYHLSLSFTEPRDRQSRKPKDKHLTELWCRAFFGDNARMLWCEPPYSPLGKKNDVWHYRLFCNPAWEPILPSKEVYSLHKTPADWKSFSEIHKL